MRMIKVFLAFLIALVTYANAFAEDPLIYYQGSFTYNGRAIGHNMPIIAPAGEEVQLPGYIEATNWNPDTQAYERQLFPANYSSGGGSCTFDHCSVYDTCVIPPGGHPCYYLNWECTDPTTSMTPPANTFSQTCYCFCVMSCSNGGDQCVPNMGGWLAEHQDFCVWGVPKWMAGLINKLPTIDDITGNPGEVNEPVDVIYGNMRTYPQNDFTLSGINEPFRFYRTYNSQSEYNGPLGYGWTHSYNVVVSKPSNDAFQIMDADGRYYLYDGSTGASIYNDGTKIENTGSPLSTIWTTRDGTKYVFPYCTDSIPYHLKRIEYKDGSQITFYPADGSLPTQITDTQGRTITLAYNSGRITDIQEPGRPTGQLIHYTYDADGNLTRVDYPVSATKTYNRQYTYFTPGNHNLTQLRDERGNSFYYWYDALDRCYLLHGDNDGQGAGLYFEMSLDYHPEALYTTVNRIRGTQTFTDKYTYVDDLYYVTQIDHQESGTTEKFNYTIVQGGDSTVEKLTMKASDGFYFKSIWTLDAGFNGKDVVEGIVPAETSAPSGIPRRFYFEDSNNPNSLTRVLDQRNSNLKLTYGSTGGAAGKITKIHKYAESAPGTEYEATNMAYNTDGTLYTITDPNSKITTLSYNPTTHVLTSIAPPGVSAINYSFDNAGRLTQINQKDDTGSYTRYTDIARDWLGRITQTTYPQENGQRLTVSIDYDATDLFDANAGYGVNVTDTNGIKTQYLYNSAGFLWKVVRDRGEGKTNAVTTFDYDAYGNLITLTDAKAQATAFAYDSLDRLTAILDAQNHLKVFTYYPDNSLKTRTDQKGQTTQYTYNSDNRLYRVTYPDASWVAYTYEPNGLLSTAQRSGTTTPVSFAYQEVNRLRETNGELSGDADKVSYYYYNGGQRYQMVSTLLGTTTYDLKTDSNALWKITNPLSRITQYAYNQYTGNLSQITRHNGTYTNYDFDNLDRLKSYMTHTTTDNNYVYNYVSDNFGTAHDTNLIQKTTYPGSNNYNEYRYDNLYRLENEYAVSGGIPTTKNYEYDMADNRTRVTDGTVDTYTVNNLNEVTAIDTGNISFEYDLNGNTTKKTANGSQTLFQYDYENRLTRITYPSNAGWTEFVYDALGRRLKAIEKNGQGGVIGQLHAVYDGLDLIADLDASNQFVAGYTHGPGIDDPLIARYNGADYYYHTNHQGSVTDLFNSSGGTVKTYKYDAFGNIIQETGPSFNRGFTYTGRERHYPGHTHLNSE